MKIIKYILSIFFLLGGFGFLAKSQILSGICLVILGIILFPMFTDKLKESINLWSKKGFRYGSYILLFILALFLSKEIEGISPSKTKESAEVSNYKPYLAKVNKNVNLLTDDRKESRQNIIDKLEETNTYKILVKNKEVSADYIPLITAINNGLRHIYKENNEELFAIDQTLDDSVKNSTLGADKLSFVIKAIVLSTPNKGGYTKELVEVFEQYRKKFNLYGLPSVSYSMNENSKTNIDAPYNMTSIFYHIEPNNNNLNAIYEANSKGAGRWFDYSKGQDYVYEHLATKKGYLSHAKRVNPNSPYILKVDYEVSAKKLFRDYQDNEIAADEIYKGKKLAVTGLIDDIGNDVLDDSYINLKTGYIMGSVQCYLDKKIVAKLKKGQKVVVIGRCNGLFGNVGLKDCSLFE
ncbi:OB-fold protein [Polaribacter glomeratus]|uniref:Uncharacterized protein n=1 Tax=Polaribacter glomeratus TaxID=102 RepID=A0A2S7WG19_9FLAO|nr:hypothetical protein [Polaribacter glomeratus]PQJ76544.1 hypothetical protein BTO16_11610 [Polaribacter glomeratus]TXD67623.1 hypothetical protein ESX12_03295 [Polaribacter glomeratus]